MDRHHIYETWAFNGRRVGTNRDRSTKRSLAIAIAAVGFVATPVLAQDDAFDLGTIVLRGELQDRAIDESPTSAIVVTGNELDRKGDQGLYDVIEREAGVSAAFGEKGFSIRGVEQSGVNGGNRALLVTTQIDGLALPSTESTFFGPFSTWDIDQIEILRGPQSTQQGRNALGGAIIVRSKDPIYDEELKFHTELGSRNHYRVATVFNTPLVEDRLAFRFSAEHFENDGTVFNPTLGISDFDGRRMTTYRSKLRWDPNENLNVVLSYAFTENFGGEDFVDEIVAGTAVFPSARINRSGQISTEGAVHNALGLRVNYQLNDSVTLESETNLYDLDYSRFEDVDYSPIPLATFKIAADTEVFEQEVRLRFNGEIVDGVVGLFYTKIEDRNIQDIIITGNSNPGDFSTTTENIAIFGEVDIAADGITPGLSFTVGARYDYEEFDFFEAATAPTQSGANTYEAFLPKLSATYAFTDTQRLSFTVQRGYRSGGAQVTTIPAVGLPPVNEFDPEFTTNYELAYRGSFYEDALRVSANVFFTEWEDQQVRVALNPALPTVQTVLNAGRSEFYGGELSVEGEPTANLSLFGSLAIVETRFLEFSVNGTSLRGNEFRGAPEVTATIGGVYRWENGLSLSVDAGYTDASFFDVQNTPGNVSDARWVVNTELVLQTDQDWVAGLYVRNIFDEDYAASRFDNSANALVAAVPTSVVRGGEPRTIGAFVTKNF